MSRYLDNYARLFAISNGYGDKDSTPEEVEEFILEIGRLRRPTGEHVDAYLQKAVRLENEIEIYRMECEGRKKNRKPPVLTMSEKKELQKKKGMAASAAKMAQFCDKWKEKDRTDEEFFQAYIDWRAEVRLRYGRKDRLGISNKLQQDYDRFY